MSGKAGDPSAAHQPKTKIETFHKVQRFGKLHGSDADEYKYTHQRVDLKVSRGHIPIGFLSSIQVQEGATFYLETRDGPMAEAMVGPQYQIRWRPRGETGSAAEQEILGAAEPQYDAQGRNDEGEGTKDGWSFNLDKLWTRVLGVVETKYGAQFSEETLDYLDADPFVLFGVDDAVTQQALQKLKTSAALMCEGNTPVFEEWAEYIRVDPFHKEMKWLVQAFAETELPKPWTCYKGVGSVVCYIRADSGQVTWKHPFYDYFRQLRDFCKRATRDEVMQVRINRLLWSYEATRVETEHDQDPLICPEYVGRMADIFGYDIKTQGFLVRNLKAQLKVFARDYRRHQNIEISAIGTCAEILNRDVEKFKEMKEHWSGRIQDEAEFELTELANGQKVCVNCGETALCFCLECKDYLCLNCYELLHNKGARLEHAPFQLVPCSLCVSEPAKLHCTFTDKSLCHECYAMRHIKMLPPDGKENQPQRIDYLQEYCLYADKAAVRQKNASFNPGEEDGDNYESVLSTDWHPFYDIRGVKYYHNFATGERMRQSPRRVPNTMDPGAEDRPAAIRDKDPDRLPLTGFDSLQTNPPSIVVAAANAGHKGLQPPYRKNFPNEIPAS
eukprot:TRINITY_DN104506_c0_g1_i1.p1 TRINITY_DN104506_c0_g1~~TRINITY_DN104506_c0_g1_i1.p1  ORF type:complete len:614 (-),score=167.57 TRINITY_DN104506_c0_g1_i1:216-2057(-)